MKNEVKTFKHTSPGERHSSFTFSPYTFKKKAYKVEPPKNWEKNYSVLIFNVIESISVFIFVLFQYPITETFFFLCGSLNCCVFSIEQWKGHLYFCFCVSQMKTDQLECSKIYDFRFYQSHNDILTQFIHMKDKNIKSLVSLS